MSRSDRIMYGIGFILVALCYIWATTGIMGRAREAVDPDQIVIRFAHWQLESGIRDAFEELAGQYMEMHPNVRVEQMLIPERVYANWFITQLVGGTAPDLIELRPWTPEERIGRYFVPLMDMVSRPNPYNEGTPLEGIPWRDTYIDGLASPPAYVPGLLDYYSIPTSIFTVRVYYNVELYRRIMGDAPIPETYEEFLELCERVRAYAEEQDEVIIPIACSQYNAPPIMFSLFSSQTQKLGLEYSADYRLSVDGDRVWTAFLRDEWDFFTSPVFSGITLMGELGRHMQSGFLSLLREDATFYFAQGRALMIASGSFDISSMHEQSPFEVDAFPIPLPDPNHPKYGQHMLGPLSEAGQPTAAAFGLTRQSENPEVALDFLHFITSRDGNQTFSDISNWLPAIVGVELPERVLPFELITEGYIEGIQPFAGPDSRRVFMNHLHRLVGPMGAPENFAAALNEHMPTALVQDFRISHTGWLRQWRRNDSVLGAIVMQALGAGPGDPEQRRLSEMLEATAEQEILKLWMENEFEAMGRSLGY